MRNVSGEPQAKVGDQDDAALAREASEAAKECDRCAEEGDYSVDALEIASDVLRRLSIRLMERVEMQTELQRAHDRWKHKAFEMSEFVASMREQ
jgi:hypothetical protein